MPVTKTENAWNVKVMKILLILPAAEQVRVTRERPQVPRRAMLRFSLLPLTVVAALTPPEHEVRIVDENVEPVDFDTDCDLVGVTFMTALARRAYEIADRFRGLGKRVVAGGFHPTLCPEDVLPHFDALVAGDAEDSWPRLLADIQRGSLRKIYRRTAPAYRACWGPGAAPPITGTNGAPLRHD